MFLALCGAVIWIWPHTVRPVGFVGQAEALDMVVASRDDGVITNLWVTPLQEVRGGDLVVEVITTDPRTVNNRLEVMRDRMRLTQLEMDPILNRQRGFIPMTGSESPGLWKFAMRPGEKSVSGRASTALTICYSMCLKSV